MSRPALIENTSNITTLPIQDHLAQCSQTLIECPNRCTAYVPRKQLEDHLQLCPKSLPSSKVLLHYQNHQFQSTSPSSTHSHEATNALFDRLQLLEHDLNRVREALHEESRQRHKLIVDVGTLRRRHAVDDGWTEQVGDVLTALKRCLGEESQTRCDEIQQLRIDIDRLSASYSETTVWREQMHAQLQQLEADMLPVEDGASGKGAWRTYIDVLLNDQRSMAMRMYKLENELSLVAQRGNDAAMMAATNEVLITEKCAQVDEIVAVRQAEHRASKRISVHDTVGRMATVDFELKSLKHICTAAEDKCDRLERVVCEVRKMASATQQQLSERLEHERLQRQMVAIENVHGHLIWRIDGFAAKMQSARDDDVTTLHSPSFCNRQYGYTLRLDVHLNGLGTWRGRHVLACLTVVPGGDWDTLLAWPCKLRADIRLRDQPADVRAANDVRKTITAKGTADVYEQAQYIFITHKSLRRGSYVRDDTIFFEVRVHQERTEDQTNDG